MAMTVEDAISEAMYELFGEGLPAVNVGRAPDSHEVQTIKQHLEAEGLITAPLTEASIEYGVRNRVTGKTSSPWTRDEVIEQTTGHTHDAFDPGINGEPLFEGVARRPASAWVPIDLVTGLDENDCTGWAALAEIESLRKLLEFERQRSQHFERRAAGTEITLDPDTIQRVATVLSEDDGGKRSPESYLAQAHDLVKAAVIPPSTEQLHRAITAYQARSPQAFTHEWMPAVLSAAGLAPAHP